MTQSTSKLIYDDGNYRAYQDPSGTIVWGGAVPEGAGKTYDALMPSKLKELLGRQ